MSESREQAGNTAVDGRKLNKRLDAAAYEKLYQASVSDNEGFWAEQASRIDWIKPFSKVKDVSFARKDLHIRWYEDGELNVCVNCVDRHLKTRSGQAAIIWEGDSPDQQRTISYSELYEEVCRLANAMEARGITKGDRVILYMPMVPQAAFAMLACARIGAVHSVVFGGFSANALADRIVDCQARMIITADGSHRGGKTIPLKPNVDEALKIAEQQAEGHQVKTVLVSKVSGDAVDWQDHDLWYDEFVPTHEAVHEAVPVNAEDPLFILYTSGSTGKPKGLQHSSGGYLVYTATTFSYTFNYQPGEVFWCAADVGWVTGHSYIVYGPLANGATTLMYEGVPTYPDVGRCGEVIDKHKVNIFYIAPTAIRTLMTDQKKAIGSSKRDSLRVLGSVGEPINPGVWQWFNDEFGKGQCQVVDTWWQTETGGIMMTPLPYVVKPKPGAAMMPFFGIQPQLVDKRSDILEGKADGHLVILDSWPGQARTIWNNHERFIDTYFSTHDGMYFTGDGAKRDEDGHFWITGRVDDVLNVSGHRLGTAEIESAVVSHPKVAEAAVVGFPHELKGEAIYVYVIPNDGVVPDEQLTKDVRDWVRKELGPVASPDQIQWTRGLPKTRSGKIMRRILRKIAANEHEALGDTSTLADPQVVDELIDNRMNR
ncbi:MAG: acetate--CoA ligase [unclassified Hahellaceae]|nr:acetate--CoA ligase [Hahellaceae bacterium]|tara:strand:+ start:42775 stop:44739 length:1965 start_codon:yes stop_codon:yes gene_type:complete